MSTPINPTQLRARMRVLDRLERGAERFRLRYLQMDGRVTALESDVQRARERYQELEARVTALDARVTTLETAP